MKTTRLFALVAILAYPSMLPAYGQSSAPLVVMNLAAHPDDEDGQTLTYYRKAKNAIAYSVIYTRGEGGQNEIGPELYEELGAIRTDETERAARILGTQIYFLNFKDFGFSKHAAEAFERWGGEDFVTARLVYLIRKLKPDLLFTNHDTVTVGPRRQHGQHQAVGISAYNAFHLAADPTFHPEQLNEEGVDLWQPKRLFLRYWRQPDSYDVAVPVSSIHEPEKASYTEIAMTALREHASQGMGMFARRFRPRATFFERLRDATDVPLDTLDLASGLPPNTTATPDLPFWIDSGRMPALPEGALWLPDSTAVPGQRIELRWHTSDLPARRINWRFFGAVDTTIYLSDTSPGIATLVIPADTDPTIPKAVHQYNRFVNHPPIYYALYRAGADEIMAAGYVPLEIAPPLVLSTEEPVMRLYPGDNVLPLDLHVFDEQTEYIDLNVAVSLDVDRSVVFQEQKRVGIPNNRQWQEALPLNLPNTLAEGSYTITITTRNTPTTAASPLTRLQMKGRVFSVNVAEGLRVGVIESYDNTLDQALTALKVDHAILDSTALATAAFDDLHTIVVDIRAYLVRQDLRMYNDKLLDWVENGGHLIVNYQKTFEWNAGYTDPFDATKENAGNFAPYPLALSRDRVTYEDAPVTVLHPSMPMFQAPNALTDTVWDNWVQERGLYFPREYDSTYEELFEMSDPGATPLRSSTLFAPYGAGTYLYTALVWYRQLKVHHPGAYKMFANFISLPLTTDL